MAQAPQTPRPPAAPFAPMMPARGVASPPAPPFAAAPAPQAQPPKGTDPAAVKEEYERKLAAMEKRLQEEREKVLLANLKSQSEAATAAKVEVAIKELQDKIRRDRRDQESEELKHKLDTRVVELETRLAQERETWLVTLKNQMTQREVQDKDFESQLAGRLQEMERRWLEEKAVWQKTVGAKDDEIRNLRNLAEKLKGVEVEWGKVSSEKKNLEERLAELVKEKADSQLKAQKGLEAEKEAIGLRAELSVARQQLASVSERLERDLQAMRQSAREREDRLTYEVDRLQRELSGLGQRMRMEHEAELKRAKDQGESEKSQYKEKADKSAADVAKLKAILAAMERQAAMSRAQVMQLRKSASEWEKTQEHYKAEFVVLQRRWADREREIRSEVEANLSRVFAADMDKARAVFEERLKKETEALNEKTGSQGREAMMEKEKEIMALQRTIEDLSKAKTGEEEEKRSTKAALEESQRGSREGAARLDASLRTLQEEAGALKADLADARERLEIAEKAGASMASEKSELQRLSMAQAAEIKNMQDAFFGLRGQLAKDAQLAKSFMEERERLERRIRELEGR
ncbi:MAG: hypothetical protein HY748_01035 [Elusimicrobia bacterium]|nr:hypothetical protein [Elusimicrobiota bacterium]